MTDPEDLDRVRAAWEALNADLRAAGVRTVGMLFEYPGPQVVIVTPAETLTYPTLEAGRIALRAMGVIARLRDR